MIWSHQLVAWLTTVCFRKWVATSQVDNLGGSERGHEPTKSSSVDCYAPSFFLLALKFQWGRVGISRQSPAFPLISTGWTNQMN